ncbi:translation initiation factor IF-2-like [Meles meles]|uniref:translation initiation factor IF-2-like n=1 Tax=Meles meles TaxID=9662 RepID=UPI001E6A0F11|nr:translation initiation factor IF-2-like [Meles meles]
MQARGSLPRRSHGLAQAHLKREPGGLATALPTGRRLTTCSCLPTTDPASAPTACARVADEREDADPLVGWERSGRGRLEAEAGPHRGTEGASHSGARPGGCSGGERRLTPTSAPELDPAAPRPGGGRVRPSEAGAARRVSPRGSDRRASGPTRPREPREGRERRPRLRPGARQPPRPRRAAHAVRRPASNPAVVRGRRRELGRAVSPLVPWSFLLPLRRAAPAPPPPIAKGNRRRSPAHPRLRTRPPPPPGRDSGNVHSGRRGGGGEPPPEPRVCGRRRPD